MCLVNVPNHPQIAPEQLKKALADLKMSKDETRTTHRLLDEAMETYSENQKIVSSLQKEVENLCKEAQEHEKSIKDLKAQIKGNMSLVEARQIVWTEIIAEVKDHWELITLANDQKNIIWDDKV